MTNFKEFTVDANVSEMDREDLEATVKKFEEANSSNADAFESMQNEYEDIREDAQEQENLVKEVVSDYAEEIAEATILFDDADEVFERFDVSEIPEKARELADYETEQEDETEFTGPQGDNPSQAGEPDMGSDFSKEASERVSKIEGVVVTQDD